MSFTPSVPRAIMATAFETNSRFTQAVGGSGASNITVNGRYLDTEASASSYAKSTWQPSPGTSGASFFTTFPMECNFSMFSNVLGTDVQMFFGIGNITVAGSGITYTNNHIGFKIVRSASGSATVSATVADGTTETATALTTVVVDDEIFGSFILDSASSARFWYRKNGGAWPAQTRITTNIPTASSMTNFMMASSNAGVATRSNSYIYAASVIV